MELGWGDKYIASDLAPSSLRIRFLHLVRYFSSSSLVKLNTNSSPSLSILSVQDMIGDTVSFLLNIALMFLGLTSIVGAFVSGCPFRSSISTIIRFIIVKPHNLLKWILGRLLSSEWIRALWIGAMILLWAAISSALAYAAITTHGWFFLLFFTAAFPMALFAQWEVSHKPQKYKISHLALWVFLSAFLFTALFRYRQDFAIPLMVVEVLDVALAMWMFGNIDTFPFLSCDSNQRLSAGLTGAAAGELRSATNHEIDSCSRSAASFAAPRYISLPWRA